MDNKELEQILDKNAKKHMLQWNLKSFKLTYPRLFKTIIDSLKEVKNENENKIS